VKRLHFKISFIAMKTSIYFFVKDAVS